MYDNAYEILEYLPRETSGESLYIDHLWGAFEAIIERDSPVQPFAILPFHLLFMFAIQFKIYRISANNNSSYLEKLEFCKLFDAGKKQTLRMNAPIPDINGVVPSHCSVRNLSHIREDSLFNLLRIICVEEPIIAKAIELVKIRGTYAHANGNIEADIEGRIDDYLEILRAIQNKMIVLNDQVAYDWLNGTEDGEDFKTSVEGDMQESNLCPADFKKGLLSLFSLDDVDLVEWDDSVSKILDSGSPKGIMWVKNIARTHFNKNFRLFAIMKLEEKNLISSEEKKAML